MEAVTVLLIMICFYAAKVRKFLTIWFDRFIFFHLFIFSKRIPTFAAAKTKGNL